MTKKTDEQIEYECEKFYWIDRDKMETSSPQEFAVKCYRLAESEALKEIESLKISHAVEMTDYGVDKIKVIREMRSINEQQTMKIVQLEQEIRELKAV